MKDETVGASMPADYRPDISATIGRLSELASPGSELLARIPPAAIADLRARTGRHKRDRPLQRNLRRMVAAVVARMDAAQRTQGVRFTATDALELGSIRAETWADLVPVLEHLGLSVSIGESGRVCRRGSGVRGRLLATTITAKTKYSLEEGNDDEG